MGNTPSLKDRVYEGWLQTASSVKYYAILSQTGLHIFESDVLSEQKPLKSIDLTKYDKIKPIRFKKTEFKYGFRLKDKTKNRIMYGCKSRNECHIWITHIDYIATHKLPVFPIDNIINKSNKDQMKNIYDILLEDYDYRNKSYIKTVFTKEYQTQKEQNKQKNDTENHKQEEHKSCNSLQNCRALLKLLLVDKIYRKWCQCYHKVRPYSINNILTHILRCDISDLLDDFVHCYTYHSYINIYNYLQLTPEYLCISEHCPLLSRNHRNREAMAQSTEMHHIHNNEISNRIGAYLCFSDSFNISTMQILDKIHSYLLHSFIHKLPRRKSTQVTNFGKLDQLDIINVNDIIFDEINPNDNIDSAEIERRNKTWKYKDNTINKFTVNCNNCTHNYETDGKHDYADVNNDDWDSGTLFTYYKPQIDMDEKSSVGDELYKTPCSMSSKRKRTRTYTSAHEQNNESDSDIDNSYGICITPKYKTFHEEITKNKIYKLSDLQFYDVYITSIYWMKTENIKNIKAKKVGILNIKSGIIVGTVIGINHVMALMFYCNYKGLQNAFKMLYKKSSDDIDKFYKKHSIIGHWSRYIFEAVNIFGDLYNGEQFLYVALNKQMLFSEWNIHFIAPVSTTDNIYIMNKYIGQSGVILKLTFKEPARYFDMSIFTDFYDENEKLFMDARFSIQDMILSNMKSLLYGMYSIELFKRILRGQVFSCFTKDLMSLKSQSILLQLMQNYMSKHIKNKGKHKYKSGNNKPELKYLCNLFNYVIDKQFKYNTKYIPCINIDEIKRLKKNLSLFYYNNKTKDNKNKLGLLIRDINGNNCDRILYAVKYEFILFEDKWDEFFQLEENKKLKCGAFIFQMNKKEKYIFSIEIGVDKNQQNCMVYLKLTTAPMTVDAIYVINNIVLKEIRSEIKYQCKMIKAQTFPIKLCKLNQCKMIKTRTLSFVMSINIISTIYK